jgi:Tfp pilus assembly protein PilX
MMPNERSISSKLPARKGIVLVVMVLMLVMVHLLVMGALAPTRDEAQLATLRIETLRAFYAAESAAMLTLRSAIDGVDQSSNVGEVVQLAGATAHLLQWPQDGQGIVVLEGRSGGAARRVSIQLE